VLLLLSVWIASAACSLAAGDVDRAADARDLAPVPPEAVGISSERLHRLETGMRRFIDDGRLAGVVTMLARHGKLAHVQVAGQKNIQVPDPLQRDSIFRIYSMTKPITGVALMILYEEGRWRLGDPVSRYIPEFDKLKVHVGEDRNGRPILEDAARSMTMRELMTHSGGLAYGLRDTPVDRMYREARVLDSSVPLQTMIDRLALLPLLSQPGKQWYYSIAVDVQGYLVEKLSGQPFDQYLQEKIFAPLGMSDTAFYVPAEKIARLALIHAEDDHGKLVPPDADAALRNAGTPPAGPSGGGGLYSTADDYLRFSQMVLDGGALDGVRILAPQTVDMMRTNHLLDEALSTMRPGTGFGLDFAVVLDAAAAGEPYENGAYYWSGAAGTWFWIDPVADLVFVGMIQHRGSAVGDIQGVSRNLTYQAIVDEN